MSVAFGPEIGAGFDLDPRRIWGSARDAAVRFLGHITPIDLDPGPGDPEKSMQVALNGEDKSEPAEIPPSLPEVMPDLVELIEKAPDLPPPPIPPEDK